MTIHQTVFSGTAGSRRHLSLTVPSVMAPHTSTPPSSKKRKVATTSISLRSVALAPVDERRSLKDNENPIRHDESKSQPSWGDWCMKWDIPRKVLHSSIGFLTLHQWAHDSNPTWIAIWLGKALVVIWSADILRFRSKRFARLYETLLGFLMRPSERTNWNGVIFYLIGVIISLTTLPSDICVLSILILSWVDTAASYVGRLYGHRTPKLPSPPFAKRKSLAGFMGAFTVGSATAVAFWSTWAQMGLPGPSGYSWTQVQLPNPITRPIIDRPSLFDIILPGKHIPTQLPNPRSCLGLVPLGISCGLISAVAESIDIFGWDDNLVLPVLSGWGIWGLMKLMG